MVISNIEISFHVTSYMRDGMVRRPLPAHLMMGDKMRTNKLPFIAMDENLSKITGTMETLQTHEVIKKFWAYIKKNNLKISYADWQKKKC